ncbi:protein arginine N-methyltransferase 5-like isoform X2 [Oppia nitens]|nr:protein arginine N-methyltransferase 5-like isoform X2 [Oppia nitens]XP_054160692.1 protein arginine N-methyltransferase 5-like isoform X2 [Oppia nitens]
MSTKELKCGYYVNHCQDLPSAIQLATNSGFNFIATNLVHPRSHDFTPYSDLQLSSSDWNTLVVGIMSDFDLLSNTLENITKMEAEITYAVHLGVPALLFQCPTTIDGINQLARIINSRLTFSGGFQNLPQFWIQIPVQSPNENSKNWRNDLVDNDNDSEDTWFWWNRLRSLIATDKRLAVALELNGDLPDDNMIARWAGEPVKAIFLSTAMFLSNRKVYPVLTKAHQLFVRLLMTKMSNDIHFIIKGHNRHTDIRHYVQYLDHIRLTQLPSDPVATFARGYEDFLQIPLQPLMDNLESCTYEVFEKDPIKYEEYGKAINQALSDLQSNEEIVIMVVGAGRGPLVEASISASQKCKKKVQIFAVEKNPNAVVTLRTLRDQRWGGEKGLEFSKVDVIACDMRDWESSKKADIVISELLGSFGDNELSPECLDGVWSYVKETAVSIPISYTSYLAPIQSQRLYSEAAQLRERDKPAHGVFETGYVVFMRNFYSIDAPKPLFTFCHNNLTLKPSERDNSRFKSLDFEVKVDTVCHGFAGYFEATLYGNIKLSTVPSTHTSGMFSWFPIYFPIFSPMFLKAGQTFKVDYWRMTSRRQIWYEWAITDPIPSAIHNPNGRTYSIGLL